MVSTLPPKCPLPVPAVCPHNLPHSPSPDPSYSSCHQSHFLTEIPSSPMTLVCIKLKENHPTHLPTAVDCCISSSRAGTPCEIPSVHTGMSTGIAIMPALFRQPYWLIFDMYQFLLMSRRYCLSLNILLCWFLSSSLIFLWASADRAEKSQNLHECFCVPALTVKDRL